MVSHVAKEMKEREIGVDDLIALRPEGLKWLDKLADRVTPFVRSGLILTC
jgi:hypothetical protein